MDSGNRRLSDWSAYKPIRLGLLHTLHLWTAPLCHILVVGSFALLGTEPAEVHRPIRVEVPSNLRCASAIVHDDEAIPRMIIHLSF